MKLETIIAGLMSAEELASSRMGILGLAPAGFDALLAETIVLEPWADHGRSCELILANIPEMPTGLLRPAVRRLCRDGIFIATVPAHLVAQSVEEITQGGVSWIAVTQAERSQYFVVAAREMHPQEFGPLLNDHIVYQSSGCVHLPQNRADRARRRHVRRHGREQLLELACKLHEEYGEEVRRVSLGIELLIAEQAPVFNAAGRLPSMVTLPDLEVEAWPDVNQKPQLKHLIEICERLGPAVSAEMRDLIASKSFTAYLDDEYNKKKFQMADPNMWQAIRLVDWRNAIFNIPSHCNATRQLIQELGPRISGEVNILRLPPNTSLPPHYDEYDFEQYIHIGVTVPQKCKLRVNGEERGWREGEPIVFAPAYLHEVWNQSSSVRDVLAIDTWHTDLSNIEIDALGRVRSELETLRRLRSAHQQPEL